MISPLVMQATSSSRSCPNTPAERAREVAERLCAAVRGHVFQVRDRDERLSTTISIGVATSPENGSDPDALFTAADRALYQVKRQGRDGVAVATAGSGRERSSPAGHRAVRGSCHRAPTAREAARRCANRDGPRIVAIAGEAGIGKTTLLKQLEPEVRLRAGSLVVGRGREADVQPPYAPVGGSAVGHSADDSGSRAHLARAAAPRSRARPGRPAAARLARRQQVHAARGNLRVRADRGQRPSARHRPRRRPMGRLGVVGHARVSRRRSSDPSICSSA